MSNYPAARKFTYHSSNLLIRYNNEQVKFWAKQNGEEEENHTGGLL